ncbi:hypothetical protein [Mycobacterium sp. shizuoka-1]|uniref:hypothetical protein n=1 Tax=Mycobacterium sp. shizuoka-1 TaxID=2039281 RepID=UPI000C063281|nr:hypothetical protein [Mycobacterium sp. shizuoka-1]GAY19299.1 hypothetical protein MSZK_60250 [Mycobacterium sp. shizuoka-1]
MSERDEDDVPASPAADDETSIDQPVHGTEGSPTDRLVDLAAAAIEAGNPLAIDGLAKAITALNGSVGSPNWHQFTPQFELPAIDFPMPKLPAIDFPMPKLPAIDFPMPKLDIGRQFDASRYNLGHTRDVVGIDALMAGCGVADNYLRGISGAGEAFTRALESIAQLDRTGPLARGYSRYPGAIATGPGSLTGWLDSAVPRVDMTAWSNVVGTASAVNTGMHDAISAAARTMLDLNRSYHALDDLISPALRNLQTRIDEFTRLVPVVQSAAGMWSTQITDLMHGWTVLSDFGHRLASKALHLALMTRDALINDTDRDAVRRAVIDFMRRVLGYKWHPTDARIEAVASALLDDAWLPPVGTAFDADYDPVDPLRKIVTYQHGLWVPLTETRRRGRTIASLDEPDRAAHDSDGDTPTTPMDRLRASEFTPKRQPIAHPVLKRVLEPLSPIEQEIVMARFCDGARTWADAAIMSGRDAREGETVRRKFLKLKKAEQQRRSA